MASEVSICNQAISWLGGNRIISISDIDGSSPIEAILCKDNYAPIRDAVLSEAAWTFATTRFIPVADAASPAYGYSTAFKIPTEILTILEVQRDPNNANGSGDIDWRREGNLILCDEKIIYVKAIQRVKDPSKFHPTFIQALAARLAAELAIPLTGNRQLQADMFSLYQEKLDTAMYVDGSQGKRDRLRANYYKRVR
jgi:hypothetical protein